MKDRASRGSASSCRTSSTASMCRSVPTAAGSMVSTRRIFSFLYLHLPLCLSLWLLINFDIFLPFCSRGVSVPGSFGTHLSAQCSQSHGTCPHVQYDIRKYMFLSLSLSLSLFLSLTAYSLSANRTNICSMLFTIVDRGRGVEGGAAISSVHTWLGSQTVGRHSYIHWYAAHKSRQHKWAKLSLCHNDKSRAIFMSILGQIASSALSYPLLLLLLPYFRHCVCVCVCVLSNE